MSLFDRCYQTRVNLEDKPRDWKEFWHQEILKVKSLPKDITVKKKMSIETKIKDQVDLEYSSVDNYRLTAHLFAAKSLPNRNVPVIIIFPDYIQKFTISKKFLRSGILVCLLQMRGHKIPLISINDDGRREEKKSYGYFAKNLDYPGIYYMKYLLLDAYQTVQVLLNQPNLDAKRIGVWGKGIGAAMALFVSKFSDHISSQVIESPGFCHLDTLKQSGAPYAEEINYLLKKVNKSSRKKLEANARYFDGAFFAEKLTVPSAFVTNLNEKKLPPEQVFSLFNGVRGDKEIHIFTETARESRIKQDQQIQNIVYNYFSRAFKLQ